MTGLLQCPVCRKGLFRSSTGYQCPGSHAFDAARQGYVNLLLAHKKHSREPGDSPDMIRSRRRFLNLGFYDGISDGINEAIMDAVSESCRERRLAVLDAGCGEGFYLNRFKEALSHAGRGTVAADYYGVDISKFAVRSAAGRDKSMHWFVASIMDLPFASSSLDVILNVFSPANFPEFSRIIGKTGFLMIAGPGPRHLNGLREIIYPIAREHAPSAWMEQAAEFFSPFSETRITYPLLLSTNRDIMDLLAMTPYFWNIDVPTKAKVEALDRLALDVDVRISVMQKRI